MPTPATLDDLGLFLVRGIHSNTLPAATYANPLFPGLRLLSFAFLREVDAMGRVTVNISPTSYEARLNKSLFERQLEEIEAESLQAGKKLVLHSTISVVLGRRQTLVA